MPIIIAAANAGNPLLVGLAAAVGGAIGEIAGYFVGRLGHHVLVRENFMCRINERFCNHHIRRDVKKHGALAIGLLAAQPILPFDIAGIIAGSLKMDFRRFFLALLAGRTVKYVALSYMAAAMGYIPFFK
jgi:membrane protein YqaA with SNARE-associated domain